MSVVNTGKESEKVVSLKFDNDDFEKNVNTSIGSLEKLNKSIDFTNHIKGGKGLDELNKTINSSDFSGMESNVNKIAQRFTNLGIMGVTALQNITNKAVDAGAALVKNLTIKPVHMGFEEYELKMSSVRTITASTGESVDTVNKYLEELNRYADETIYSFSDMTNNIGKFTNAGVKLKDAVAAIKGISNEAAISGANANEASRAMYNFSQALSAGYVKLIDWKSIENANMATKQFKEQLIETAVATGTLVKKGEDYQSTTKDNKGNVSQLFNATKGFNEALQSQWMTTEVLTRTLRNYSTDVSKMSDEEKKAYEQKLKTEGYNKKQIKSIMELGKKATDAAREVTTWSKMVDALQEAVQSGWSRTFELLFGDLNEAKKLWTNINDVVSGFIGRVDDARNNLLKAWKDAGGRTALLNGIANILKYIGSLLKPIGKAFREVFPPTSGKALAELTKKFEAFTKTLKANKETTTNIKDTFKGLFSIVSLIKDVFVNLVKAVLPAGSSVGSFGKIIFSVTGAIGRFITAIVTAVKNTGIIEGTFQKIGLAIKGLIGLFEGLANSIESVLTPTGSKNKGSDGLFGSFVKDVSELGKQADNINSKLTPLEQLEERLSNFGKGEGSKSFGEKLKNVIGDTDFSTVSSGLGNILKILGIAAIVKKIAEKRENEGLFKTIKKPFISMADMFDGVKGILTGIGTTIGEISGTVKAARKNIQYQSFKIIATSILMLAASVYILSKIPVSEMKRALIAVTYLSVLLLAVARLASGDAISASKMAASAASFTALSISINLIAIAAKIFATMSVADLVKSGAAITAFILIIAKVSTAAKGSVKGALSFALVATAIGASLTLLLPSILILSKMSIAGMLKAGLAIVSFVVLISKAASIAGKDKISTLQFIGIATAMALLIPSILALSKLPFAMALKAAASIATIIVLIGVASKKVGNDKIAIVSFLAIAAGVNIITPAIIALANLPFGKAFQGISALVGIMATLTVSLRLMAKSNKSSLKNSAMLLTIAIAVRSIAYALVGMSKVPFSKLLGSLIAMNAAIVSLSLTSRIAAGSKKNMLTMAVVLLILSGMVKTLASVNPGKAIVNLIGLSALMSSVGLLVLAMSKIKFGGAISALAKFSIFVAGVTLIAVGIGKLAQSFDGFESAIKKGAKIGKYIGEFVGNIVGGLIGGISSGLVTFGKNLSKFMEGLKPFIAGVKGMDNGAVACVKNLAEAILYITAADLLNQLNSTPLDIFRGNGGGMVSFAEDLGLFVQKLIPVGKAASKVPNVKKLGAVAAAMKELGKAAANVPSVGGLRGAIMGVHDLGSFGRKLQVFVKVLNNLTKKGDGSLDVSHKDMKKIKRVVTAIKELGGAAKQIPESLSLKGIIMGVKDISAFAGQLKTFAPKFSDFLGSISGKDSNISKKSLTRAVRLANVVKELGIAAGKIPDEVDPDSISAAINGCKDLPTFAEGMTAISKKIPDLIEGSKDLDKKATVRIKRMASVIKAMAVAAAEIQEITDSTKPIGEQTRAMLDSLSSFTDKMGDYVPGFKSFAKKANGINKKHLKAAKIVSEAIKSVADAATKLNTNKGGVSGKEYKKILTGISDGITAYVTAVTTFKTKTIEKRTEALTSSISDVAKALDKKGNYKKAAVTSVKAYVNALKDEELLAEAGENAQDIRIAVTSKLRAVGAFEGAGRTAVSSFSRGLTDKKVLSKVRTAGSDMSSAARKSLSSKVFKSAGVNAALGFAKGLRDKEAVADVMSAGSELGALAYNAARKALDEKSPSKKMAEVGRFAALGMSGGLRKYSDEVYKEAYTVGEKGLEGANKGISGIDDIFGNPTITPVIDLTNVENGANKIDNLLGRNVHINGALVDSAINRQNGGKTEEMINTLGAMIRDSRKDNTGTIYNIGDVSLDVTKLEDATTLEDIVTVFRRAKSMV